MRAALAALEAEGHAHPVLRAADPSSGRHSYLGQTPRALRRRVALGNGRLRVRLVEPGDFECYASVGPPPDWCIEGKMIGHVAVRGGHVVAIGVVTWDVFGRAWAWFESRECLPAIILHRRARYTLGVLRNVREPALYTFRNLREPSAAKWLGRLGFQRTQEFDGDPNLNLREVWKCALSS